MGKKIFFVIPNLKAGGQERVVAEIANNFAARNAVDVYLILFTKATRHYYLTNNITIFEPGFASDSYIKLVVTFKAISFIRKSVRSIKPDVVVSFGEMWNSLVLVSCLFIKTDIYVSDRSRPSMKLAPLHSFFRRLLYPSVTGIIAQTELAKQIMYRRIKHPNIAVIGNPIRNIPDKGQTRKNIILNVGRFVSTKRQSLIIKMFSEMETDDWTLMFLGDGHMIDSCKALVQELGVTEKVVFVGQVGNTDDYYRMSKIFAFVSNSEGFPNVLGEAQSAGLAVITFDFEAGARDLVENNVNGFLISEGDIEAYKAGLRRLMEDEQLRTSFSKNASKKIAGFERSLICDKLYAFLTGSSSAMMRPVITSTEIKLSIIIPVYNVQEYIDKCLLSCLDQDMDYHQFEIIVINDGSTDDTFIRASAIAEKYRNIRILNQENSGPSVARNRGIKEATGEYLWFVDGDDWIDKNCFKHLYETASGNVLDLLWIRSRRINGSRSSHKAFPPRNLSKKIHNGPDFLDKVFSLCCFSTHFIINRTFLLQTGCTFTKGIIYEDSEFMPRVIMRAERVKYEDIICYNYVKRETSLINAPNPRKIDYLLFVINSNIKIINANSNKKVTGYYKRLLTHLVLILLRLSSQSVYQEKQKNILAELQKLKIRKLKLIGPMMNLIGSNIFNLSPKLLLTIYNLARRFR